MPPAWYKTCETMQKYCEPYFAAVERWRKYEDEAMLRNRVQLLATAEQLLSKYSADEVNYVFDLTFAKPDATLLPEVVPTAGKMYLENGDREAFESSKMLVPPNLFVKIGVFFQKVLLKPMAGWNEPVYKTLNHRNRGSLILAIEKLFRTSESSGLCQFVS